MGAACLSRDLIFTRSTPAVGVASCEGTSRPHVVSSIPFNFRNTENIVSNKGQLLQDPFLNTLRREHIPVSIYLVNGIKLQGQIESFDQYVVLLRNTVTQMVYKHAISTIVPGRAVNFQAASDNADADSN